MCWAAQGARLGLCLPSCELPELEKVRGALAFGRLSANRGADLEVWKKLLLDERGFREAKGLKFQWLFHGGRRDWALEQPYTCPCFLAVFRERTISSSGYFLGF